MESKSTSGVVRRKPPSFRFYPYASGSSSGKKDMKDEVIRLGVEFSVSVAESMFLLCDDIRTMLFISLALWKYVLPERNPVVERLFLLIHYIYSKDIKPKNEVLYQNGEGKSAQWNLIKTTWNDFVCGIIVLNRLVLVLRVKDCSYDDRLLLSAIAKYKQELKNLEEGKEEIPREIKNRMLRELFKPIDGETWDIEIKSLPLHSPYILERDFAKQELKDEVVRLGVELSLYIAQAMFLLLLRVIHYVYFKYIEPKNGVYRNGGLSVQMRLAIPTWENFDDVILSLNVLVPVLRQEGRCACGRNFMSSMEEQLKKVEEKLRCGKVVSEANGFSREVIEPSFFGLWKSLFNKEANNEATQTLKVIKNRILRDLFLPLHNEVAPPP
ncbi:BnaC02g42780D [Brassica napus]|uniref:BnaC02g42780D protein n=1 Tax=Brassica napus TaxID=3708 RepID=A0A078HMU3_BRANA|nr:BnaC02g42780D [Brassica napus]